MEYLSKGFQTSANQMNQKMRRDLMSDGVLKKHKDLLIINKGAKENLSNQGIPKEKTLDSSK
jgi:hypothetical protein